MLDKLIKLLPSRPVFAHCDIPCGIYDPHAAQMAAHTVIRITNLILDAHPESDALEHRRAFVHQMARLTKVKEEHGGIVEHELVILWADYFKEEHLKDYPELHDLVWKTLKLASKTKQNIDLEAAGELLKNVQEIAEIFWKTKKMEPVRVPSGYPTEGEIVTHK
ncbi:MAG: superoxide dismutase, Ni [Microgenomates group bacterium Gr01-1014_80]|nr:MAG: superoxide dismutase, Ni [Microgenomates group bacterium Gr01-1014_80]